MKRRMQVAIVAYESHQRRILMIKLSGNKIRTRGEASHLIKLGVSGRGDGFAKKFRVTECRSWRENDVSRRSTFGQSFSSFVKRQMR